MTDPVRTTAPAEHARHDLSIVAVLAARPADLDEKDSAAARAQVASCSTCADALADLLALQTTLPETATPPRPRDFRLTPADAQRLHQSGWRRFLGYFGSPRDGFSRPLAIGLTTLGLAGILLASIPSTSLMGGSGGAAPANEAAPIQQAAPAPAASVPGTDRTALGAALPSAAASALTEVAAAAPSASTVFGGAAPAPRPKPQARQRTSRSSPAATPTREPRTSRAVTTPPFATTRPASRHCWSWAACC